MYRNVHSRSSSAISLPSVCHLSSQDDTFPRCPIKMCRRPAADLPLCLRKIITPQFKRHSAERSSWIIRSRPSAWRAVRLEFGGRWPRSKSWKKWYAMAIDGCFMVCTCLYHPLWFIHVFTMTHRPIGTYILFMVMPWESWNNGPPFDWPSPQDWVQWATVACCNIPRRKTQHLRIS
jgi:hypothetical protein